MLSTYGRNYNGRTDIVVLRNSCAFYNQLGFFYARVLHARYLISECKVFYCRTVQNFVSFLQLNRIKNNVYIIK